MRVRELLPPVAAAMLLLVAVPGHGGSSKSQGRYAASGGSERAVTPLVSGISAPYNLPAVTQATLFVGDFGYSITVPSGATQLRVEIVTATPNVDVDLYVRRNAEPAVDPNFGDIIADFSSEGLTGNETITVTNPPSGTYFMGLGLFTGSVTVTGRITATVTGGSTPPPTPPPTGTNRLVNGGADLGPASPSCGPPASIPGWVGDGTVGVCAYSTGSGYPVPADPGPPDRGANFFTGGSAAVARMSQFVAVTDAEAGQGFTLSGYLGGFAGDGDNAKVTANFRNAAGQILSTAIIGPVTPADRANRTGLLARSISGTVPAGTRNVEVIAEFTRVAGSANDGYADSLSFTLGSGGTAPPTPPPSGANLITNGGFELPAHTASYLTYTSPSQELTGWQLTAGSLDHIRTLWTPSEGSQSLDMNGFSPATITQTFATVAGTTYTVSFDLAGNPDGGGLRTIRVGAAGQSRDFTFDTSGRTYGAMGWARQTWAFTASGTSTVLSFASQGAGPYGPALDNVVVTGGGTAPPPPPPPTGANLLSNGGFELPVHGSAYLTYASPSAALTGWQITAGDIDHIRTLWQHPEGSQSVDMNGFTSGTIAQTFPTAPGAVYSVSFDLAGNADGGIKVLRVGAAGQTQDFTFNTIGRSYGAMGWARQNWTFTANSNSTTITFASQTGGGAGPALDNVVVTGSGGAPPSPPPTGNSLLANGGFELPVHASTFLTYVAPSTALTGWQVAAGEIDHIRTFWTASEGNQSVDMNGTTQGVITQTFTTTAGTSYTVAFDLAGHSGGGPPLRDLRVSAAGQTMDFQFDATGKISTNMGWVRRTWVFTANATSTTLRFESRTPGAWGPAIDNVTVVAGGTAPPPPPPPTGCNFFVNPTSSTQPAGGGTGLINVVTGATCDWTAASNAAWITVEAGRTGRGNGAVSYRAAANTEARERTGTITVAGQTHTVTQAAGTACNYTILPTSATAAASGATGSVAITTTEGCAWTVTSGAAWLTGSPTSGSGPRSVTWTAAPNTAATSRTGTLTIAGRTFTVTQAGAPAAGGIDLSDNAIINAASGISPSLPGGALAQGSFFSIFVQGAGPAVPAQASSYPLSTNLGGTTVEVRQGATSVLCFLVFTSATQINGILPSNAPLGDAQMIVSFAGRTSRAARVRIVRNNFGIFSVGGGRGPGIVQNFNSPTDQPLNTRSNTARPRQVVTAWGTGGGPIATPDSQTPPVGNLPFDFEMLVGGQRASLLYYGRAPCCAGVDQIVAELAANTPAGCNVPVQIRAGETWSNTVTIAVHPDGQACQDARNPVSGIPQTGGKVGVISLLRLAATARTATGTDNLNLDLGIGLFANAAAGGELGYNPLTNLPPPGSCQALNGDVDLAGALGGSAGGALAPGTTVLNAGQRLTVTDGAGRVGNIDRSSDGGTYLGLLGGGIPGLGSMPLFLNPGTFRIRGPGGPDVGAFDTSVTFGAGVSWTNRAQVPFIDRRTPFEVTWTGGAAEQGVLIVGFASDQRTRVSSGFSCLAPAAAGRFTVPAYVMTNMPVVSATADPEAAFALLTVGSLRTANFPTFTAPGLDLGVVIPAAMELTTVEVR